MGRIREMIDVNGRNSWTLFDTSARNAYILPAVASVLTVHKARHPVRTALGGGVKVATEMAILEADLKGRPISTPTRWCWIILVWMRKEKKSRSSSARWQCNSGVLDFFLRRKNSICPIIQENSWNGKRSFHYREKRLLIHV
uniref:Uncharacterized protein n=1 Tax=Candidatus Kentrum sp. SD TaxID=2126332 RepID=A0A450Z4K9_9GAMM|nr:MAG: hypothetical protein BECKSD772F_GA0070984_10797 [Candidatus Kentron sp. SD]VFK48740.1 MAG: hypothetical protein BECKSD772E_GA0070983_11397 [Candidatus Kentron sp. SD]